MNFRKMWIDEGLKAEKIALKKQRQQIVNQIQAASIMRMETIVKQLKHFNKLSDFRKMWIDEGKEKEEQKEINKEEIWDIKKVYKPEPISTTPIPWGTHIGKYNSRTKFSRERKRRELLKRRKRR